MTDKNKFQINTYNKPGQLSVDDWLKINTCNKLGKISFFLSGQILIPKTRQDNYLNDQQFSSFRLIPVTSQENYLWTSDCRLIPVTSQESYLRKQIED